MGEMHNPEGGTDTAGPVDATHITGDVWFINRYGSGWYMAGLISAVLLAPVGVPLLAYLLWKSLHTDGEPATVYARE